MQKSWPINQNANECDSESSDDPFWKDIVLGSLWQLSKLTHDTFKKFSGTYQFFPLP